jgi:hypothetical protein
MLIPSLPNIDLPSLYPYWLGDTVVINKLKDNDGKLIRKHAMGVLEILRSKEDDTKNYLSNTKVQKIEKNLGKLDIEANNLG